MRLGLQIVLGVLSLIPAAFGALNTLQGAARFLPPEQMTAAMDSQFRFQSAYYFGLALIIWWIIPSIERHTTLFRLLIAVLFLGGVARAYSYATVGPVDQIMTAAMILELCMPVLILWQAKIASDTQRSTGDSVGVNARPE